jgi:hypothetical protein
MFVNEECTIDEKAETKASVLFKCYKLWAEGLKLDRKETLNSTAFGRRITANIKKDKRRDATYYVGIRIKTDDEKTAETTPPKGGESGELGGENGGENGAKTEENPPPCGELLALRGEFEGISHVLPQLYSSTREDLENTPQPTTPTTKPDEIPVPKDTRAGDLPPLPTAPCYACKSIEWYYSADGQPVCGVCHPEPNN